MLQLNIWSSWWWAYVPETYRAKNTSIKLPSCIKLAFHFISLRVQFKPENEDSILCCFRFTPRCKFRLQGPSRTSCCALEDRTDRLSRNVGRPTSQKKQRSRDSISLRTLNKHFPDILQHGAINKAGQNMNFYGRLNLKNFRSLDRLLLWQQSDRSSVGNKQTWESHPARKLAVTAVCSSNSDSMENTTSMLRGGESNTQSPKTQKKIDQGPPLCSVIKKHDFTDLV